MSLCKCSQCEAGESHLIESYYVELRGKPIYGSFNDYGVARVAACMAAKANEGAPVEIYAEFDDGKIAGCAELICDDGQVIFDSDVAEPDYEDAVHV